MNHGVAYVYTGRDAVEDEASSLLLQQLNQLAMGDKILIGSKDGSGEVAFKGVGGAEEVAGLIAVDEECVGSEDLVRELRFREKFIETYGEDFSLGETGRCALRSWSTGGKGNLTSARVGGACIGAGDVCGEECGRRSGLHHGAQRVEEGLVASRAGDEYDAGLGALLACAESK